MPSWSGCPTASTSATARTSSAGLAGLLGNRPITVVEGGTAACARAGRRRQRRRRADGQGSARGARRRRSAGIVRALDLKGLPLGETRLRLRRRRRARPTPRSTLPVEIRNDIARLEIVGRAFRRRGAAARQALAPPHRRHRLRRDHRDRAAAARLDLLSGARARPVRRRARSPSAPRRRRRSRAFSTRRLPMLVLADVGNVAGEARERLTRWIDDGGVLVRFAGPRLAASRRRPRAGETAPRRPHARRQPDLGEAAAARRVFTREGPFGGMTVPGDVTVTRQVLAEPDAGIAERTWAALADGTPLVTGARRGKGLIVLFHVTADTRWSNLPLSGAFVDMLKRIVSLAGSGTATEASASAGTPAAREVVAPTRTARRLRRLRPAAGDRAAGAGELRRPRAPPTIRPASTARRRACSRSTPCAGRPARAARLLAAQRAARSLSRQRAAAICAARSSWSRWRCCCSMR